MKVCGKPNRKESIQRSTERGVHLAMAQGCLWGAAVLCDLRAEEVLA